MSTERAELYNIIDSLSAAQLVLAKKLLSALSDTEINGEVKPNRLYRLSDVINGVPIPEDDEPITEADLKDFAEAEEDLKHGRIFSMDEVKKELGL